MATWSGIQTRGAGFLTTSVIVESWIHDRNHRVEPHLSSGVVKVLEDLLRRDWSVEENLRRGERRVGAEAFFSLVRAGAAGLEGKGRTDEFVDEGIMGVGICVWKWSETRNTCCFLPPTTRGRDLENDFPVTKVDV